MSLSAILLGTSVHFWILGRLERAGIKVRYFANAGDNLLAYKTYRHLARSKGWPLWPSYAVFAGYVGVLFLRTRVLLRLAAAED